MKRIAITLAGSAIAAVVALTGCHGSSGSGAAADGAASRASALASSSSAALAKQNLAKVSAKCGTTTAVGQLAALNDMKTHAGREKFMAKCGIPKSQYATVEAQILDAVEQGHLMTGGHSARVILFTQTIPAILLKAQA